MPYYIDEGGQTLFFLAEAITSTIAAPTVYQLSLGEGLSMPVKEAAASGRSWMEVSAPNVLLVAACPAEGGKGVLLQFRETEGKEAALKVEELLKSNIFRAVSEVNLFGEEIQQLNKELKIGALETRFVWLKE